MISDSLFYVPDSERLVINDVRSLADALRNGFVKPEDLGPAVRRDLLMRSDAGQSEYDRLWDILSALRAVLGRGDERSVAENAKAAISALMKLTGIMREIEEPLFLIAAPALLGERDSVVVALLVRAGVLYDREAMDSDSKKMAPISECVEPVPRHVSVILPNDRDAFPQLLLTLLWLYDTPKCEAKFGTQVGKRIFEYATFALSGCVNYTKTISLLDNNVVRRAFLESPLLGELLKLTVINTQVYWLLLFNREMDAMERGSGSFFSGIIWGKTPIGYQKQMVTLLAEKYKHTYSPIDTRHVLVLSAIAGMCRPKWLGMLLTRMLNPQPSLLTYVPTLADGYKAERTRMKAMIRLGEIIEKSDNAPFAALWLALSGSPFAQSFGSIYVESMRCLITSDAVLANPSLWPASEEVVYWDQREQDEEERKELSRLPPDITGAINDMTSYYGTVSPMQFAQPNNLTKFLYTVVRTWTVCHLFGVHFDLAARGMVLMAQGRIRSLNASIRDAVKASLTGRKDVNPQQVEDIILNIDEDDDTLMGDLFDIIRGFYESNDVDVGYKEVLEALAQWPSSSLT